MSSLDQLRDPAFRKTTPFDRETATPRGNGVDRLAGAVTEPTGSRTAHLGETVIELEGPAPRVGTTLVGEFALAPAHFAPEPLLAADLRDGPAVVSTLPNIEKHACIFQIVDLERELARFDPPPRLVHVASDSARHWTEVEQYHPELRAPGYSLGETDAPSRDAFKAAFGVGVRGHRRIAHGLFALQDGVFLAVEIPDDQMSPPPVRQFLHRLSHLGSAARTI